MTEQRRIIRFVYKTPLALAVIMGALYGMVMVLNYREDTTNITNAGFAIMASLAAISFSFARVVETDELRDRIMFAGERLLHGAILMLTASTLKYLVFLILNHPLFPTSTMVEVAMMLTVGLLTSLIFINGILFAHTGLRVLNDLLLLRFTRQKDWDNLW